MVQLQAVRRWLTQSLPLAGWLFCALFAQGAWGAVDVRQAEHGLAVGPSLLWWLDTSGQTDIGQVASPENGPRFEPASNTSLVSVQRGQKIWARLDLYRASGSPQQWALSLPINLVDRVALYQPRQANGPGPLDTSAWPAAQPHDPQWHMQLAGDRVAVDRWPVPGRYPVFYLSLPQGSTSVYLSLENETPLPIPFELSPMAQMVAEQQSGSLGVGIVLGVMVLLALVCAATGYTYRDTTFILYAGFVLLMSLAIAALTGTAAHLLWPNAPAWADLSVGVLTFLAVGAALYFLNTNMSIGVYAPRLSVGMQWLGFAALPFALIYMQMPRPQGIALVGGHVLAAGIFGLGTAVWRLRAGDPAARWVVWGYVPLLLAILLLLLRIAGVLPPLWIVQNGILVALLIQVPCMLVALNIRSRERHAAQTREQALNREDALTGLLTLHVFHDRLEHALRRAKGVGEPCALVMARLINHEQIVNAYGDLIGQQAYTRSGLKLRRILRDVDSAARVDGAYFALLLPGRHKREDLQALCARLIAVGLMPITGAKPPFPLQFHVCVTLLDGAHETAGNLLDAMRAVLAAMHPRSRRAIRWLGEADASDQDRSDSAPRSRPDSDAASAAASSQT
jgi:two-component system, sensor histidine kinase LadS